MKILLIKPNICVRKGFYLQSKLCPPIGLSYLAGALIKEGYDVNILDMLAESDQNWPFKKTHICYGMTNKKLIEYVNKEKPNLIGIGGFTTQYARIKEIIEILKLNFLDILVVLGGIHATSMPLEVMKQTKTDFVIQGEGENSIVALVNSLKVKDFEKFSQIDGLIYRKDEKIIINKKTCFEQNLDSIASPAYHLLNHEEYIKDKVAIPVITSRGCPGRCVFCSVQLVTGSKWRARAPFSVVDEIEKLVSKWGYTTVSIFDDASNVKPERLIEICKEIVNRKLDVRLTFPSSLILKFITKELLYWMKQAGAISISIPIEHVNEQMRNKIIKKNLKMDHIFKVLKWCRELKMLALINFVIGMPGETEETLKEIVYFVKENAFLMDSLSVYIATPFPGTEFFKHCLENKYISNLGKDDFLDWDLYTSHINTPLIKHSKILEYKKKIDETFIKSRGDNFCSDYIRKAIRKPDKETIDYIETVYFA